MSFTARLLNNRHAIWALALAVALAGVAAYFALPMQLFPDTAPPMITVVTQNPGASAQDIAQDLGDPIEEALLSLEGVTLVRATALDNLSLITAEFAYGRDRGLAAVDVQNAIARIRRDLPPTITEPQVLSFSTADRPILTLGARLPDLTEARRLAEDALAPALQRVPGVAAVDVFGGYQSAVLIEVRPEALRRYGLPLQQIAAAARAALGSQPAGRLRTERSQAMLRLEARATSLEDLRSAPLILPDGGLLRLEDLAQIRLGALDDDARFAIDGEAAIALQVFKTVEANTVDVAEAVHRAAQELERSTPGLRLVEGEETATFTRVAVSNLLEGVWQALLLAALLIFLFLGHPRASAVAILSMPLSYGITFALMYAFDVPFDMVTLSAVILAVGMVVDASVVVLENITRIREEEGRSALDAAIQGTDQIRGPVLAGAATTLTVLVPLTLLPGFVGRTFGPLAMTLLFAFTASLAVALLLVPVLSLYTAGDRFFDRLGVRIVWPFTWLMGHLRDLYGVLLRIALKARPLTLLLAFVALALSGRALMGQGMDVLPKMDSGAFFISLETASDSSLDDTERWVREVEAWLLAEPEVVRVQTQMGLEPGMRSSQTRGANQAYLSVTLSDRTARSESIWQIEARARAALRKIPGITHAVVRESGNTARPTSAAPVVLRLKGADPAVLDRLAADAIALLEAVPGVVAPTRSWRIDQQQPRLIVDDLRARSAGLTPQEVAGQLLAATEGLPAGVLRESDGRATAARVRVDRASMESREALLATPLAAPKRPQGLAARELVQIEMHTGAGLVTRESGLSTLDLSASVDGRALSFVIADIERALPTLAFPHGYSAQLSGENDDLAEARRSLGGTLAVSIVAVYLLLVGQLRSFLHPLTILLSIPLSVIGVATALVLAGKPISMPVMVGLILLVGTVVNNAIILIDFIQEARRSGADRREALFGAVRTRFRPIMMTSLSTIVGMIPLAAEWGLGTERFSPLALAVIGGMTASTFLTLVVIPTAYDLADSVIQRLRPTREQAPDA